MTKNIVYKDSEGFKNIINRTKSILGEMSNKDYSLIDGKEKNFNYK